MRHWIAKKPLKSKSHSNHAYAIVLHRAHYSYLSLFYYHYCCFVFRTRLTLPRYGGIHICTIKWNESSISNCIIKCVSLSLKHSFRCRFVNIHFPFNMMGVRACVCVCVHSHQSMTITKRTIASTHARIHSLKRILCRTVCWYASREPCNCSEKCHKLIKGYCNCCA